MSKVSIKSSRIVICPNCSQETLGYNIGLGQNSYHAHWSEENQKWEVVKK